MVGRRIIVNGELVFDIGVKAGTVSFLRIMIIREPCHDSSTTLQNFESKAQKCLQLCNCPSEVSLILHSLERDLTSLRHYIHISGARNCDDASEGVAN